MNSLSRPLLFSLLVHGTLFLFAVNLAVTKRERPIVVELTLSSLPSGPRGDKGVVAAKEGSSAAAPVERRGLVDTAVPRQEIKPLQANAAKARATEHPAATVPRPAPTVPAVTGQAQPSREAGPAVGRQTAGSASMPGSSVGKSENAGHGGGTGPANGKAGGPGSGGGHGNAAGASPEILHKRYLGEHFAYILKIIQDHMVYPQKARREGLQGKAFVSFIVLEDGQVENIRLLRSTGHEILDLNLVKAIREAAPFPKPPKRAELQMTLSYRLDR